MNSFPTLGPFIGMPVVYVPSSRIDKATENAYMSCVPDADWADCPYKEEWTKITENFAASGCDVSKFNLVAFPDKPTNDKFFLVLTLSLKSPNLEMP